MTEGKGVCTVRHFSGRSARDQGAAAVEFAILLPLFVMLCFGTISGGIVFNDKLSLTQGVREAARYGATLPYNTASSTGLSDWMTAVRTTAIGDTLGQIGTDSVSYCVGFRTAAGVNHVLTATSTAAVTGTCPGAPSLNNGSLTVVGDKDGAFELIVARYPVGLRSVAVARYEIAPP